MQPISAVDAEKIIGHRLDRRRKYARTDDGRPDDSGFTVFVAGSFPVTCGGCNEGLGGPHHPRYHVSLGMGCPECGYHGFRICRMWFPAVPTARSGEERGD